MPCVSVSLVQGDLTVGVVQPGSLMGACGGEWRVEGDGNLYLRNYRKQSLYCCE